MEMINLSLFLVIIQFVLTYYKKKGENIIQPPIISERIEIIQSFKIDMS